MFKSRVLQLWQKQPSFKTEAFTLMLWVSPIFVQCLSSSSTGSWVWQHTSSPENTLNSILLLFFMSSSDAQLGAAFSNTGSHTACFLFPILCPRSSAAIPCRRRSWQAGTRTTPSARPAILRSETWCCGGSSARTRRSHQNCPRERSWRNGNGNGPCPSAGELRLSQPCAGSDLAVPPLQLCPHV